MKIGLEIKAQMENITNLKTDGEDFRWYLKLKCVGCGDVTKEFVYLTLEENQPLKGGRGHASLVIKCKLCSRENSIDINKDDLHSYNLDDANSMKRIVSFDCRGVEPIEFSPRVGWLADSSESTTKFTEVDLSELEWVDFDEKSSISVGIYELEHQFNKVK